MELVERTWMVRARLQARAERSAIRIRAGHTAQSTVEYALVGALVVIAAAAALTALGSEVTSVFSKITTTLSGKTP